MNKLLILAKNFHTFFIERLQQEATCSVSFLNPWESDRKVQGDEKILVRSTSIHGSRHDLDYLERHKLQSIPSLHALKKLRTKPLQFRYFEEQGITHLPWLDLANASSSEIELFASFCEGKKLLIKPQRGQGGWGVRVFENVEELLTWWNQAKDREYLLQPFIEEHEEFRVFFMGNEYLGLKRISNGIAANFTQGGEAIEFTPTEELKEIVQKIKEDLGLIYGAADFLCTQGPKGTAYLLEMNLVPGIEQLEKVTRRNVAKELLRIFGDS